MLFSPTLEDAISQDHPVRLLDEILRQQDWSEWVTPCTDHCGRPPIHPRTLAAIVLYGLMRRIRSSRMLEYPCGHNLDFLWLAEGHRPDHTTLSTFRKESGKALKGLDALFDRMMGEADQADVQSQDGLFAGESVNHLPPELASVEQRRQKLQEILQTLQSQDSTRRKVKKNPEKNPAQLPQADIDSCLMPNKEGGYAANYTPTAAVDVSSDFIVDCEVIADPNEHTQTLAAVDRIEENFGQKPEAFLADTAHGTGENLEGMTSRKVAFLTPMESSQPQEGNPARRDDPTQPVAEADWPRLPRNAQKQLDKRHTTALAWNLKSWWALWLPEKGRWHAKHAAEKSRILGMEFKTFLNAFVKIPCQIVRAGRQLVYRVYNPHLSVFFRMASALRC